MHCSPPNPDQFLQTNCARCRHFTVHWRQFVQRTPDGIATHLDWVPAPNGHSKVRQPAAKPMFLTIYELTCSVCGNCYLFQTRDAGWF